MKEYGIDDLIVNDSYEEDLEEAIENLLEKVNTEFEYDNLGVKFETDDDGYFIIDKWTYDAGELDASLFEEALLDSIRDIVGHTELSVEDINLFNTNEKYLDKLNEILPDYLEPYAEDDCLKKGTFENSNEARFTDSDYKGKTEYKGFTIEHFPLTWNIGGKEFESDGYIILSEATLGNDLFLPLYCENEEGKTINFKTLDEAKNWIDKYGDNYELVIKHRDEIHAVPNVQKVEDSKDYKEDYQEEDFKEITNEELEEINEKEELAKDIEITSYNNDKTVDTATIHRMPSKENFVKWCKRYMVGIFPEITFKYGNKEINVDSYTEYRVECFGYDWICHSLEEVYDCINDLDKKISEIQDIDAQQEIWLSKAEKDLDSYVDKLNTNPTIELFGKFQGLIGTYSDIYKDHNGYRPRGLIGALNSSLNSKAKKIAEEFNNLSWDDQCKLMFE